MSKLSSVKKLIVLGAVADVPENYFNVKVMLDQLNIEALEFTMSKFDFYYFKTLFWKILSIS